MAVDETLMESARAGRVTLRLYRWEPGCLSFGRNQEARERYDALVAALGDETTYADGDGFAACLEEYASLKPHLAALEEEWLELAEELESGG